MIGLGAIFAQTAGGSSGSTKLSTPTLSATVQSNGGVLLQSSSVTNADGYVFERSPDEFFDVSGNITEVADSSARNITDGNLDFGQTYFYRVKATDSGATYTDSNYSIIKQVDLNILTTPSLGVVEGDTEVSLSWGTVTNATKYLLQRDTVSGFTNPVNVYSSSGLSVTDTGLTNDTTYYYRIKAQGIGVADSPYSSTVTATPTGSAPSLPSFSADILDSISTMPRLWLGLVRGTATYTGQCARIRRDSDDLETDIQYCGGFIDEEQITQFCATANGYIVTLYDNINGYDATQSIKSAQPKIYDGATQSIMYDTYGNVTMYFDGVDDMLNTSSSVPSVFANNAVATTLTAVEPISFNDTIQEAFIYGNGSSNYQHYAIAMDDTYIGVRVDDGPNLNNYISAHSGSVLSKAMIVSAKFSSSDAVSDTNMEIYQNSSSLTVTDSGSTRVITPSGRLCIGNALEAYISVHTDFDQTLSSTDFDTLRQYIVGAYVTNKNINDATYLQGCDIPVPEDPIYTAWSNEAISLGYNTPSTSWSDLYRIFLANIDYYGIDALAFFGFRHDGSKEFSFINAFDPTGAKATDAGHAVTWTTKQGIDTGGTGYVDIGRTLASITGHAQDDASIFVFARNVTNDGGYIFGAYDGTNTTEIKDASGAAAYALNGTTVTSSATLTDGTIEVSRSASSDVALIIDGVVSDVGANTSTGVPAVNMYLGAKNNNGTATGITDCVIDHLLICSNETAHSDVIRALFINFYNDANLL